MEAEGSSVSDAADSNSNNQKARSKSNTMDNSDETIVAKVQNTEDQIHKNPEFKDEMDLSKEM